MTEHLSMNQLTPLTYLIGDRAFRKTVVEVGSKTWVVEEPTPASNKGYKSMEIDLYMDQREVEVAVLVIHRNSVHIERTNLKAGKK